MASKDRAPVAIMLHTRYLQPGGEDRVFEVEVDLLRRAGWRVHTLTDRNREPKGLRDRVRMGGASVWSSTWHARLRRLIEDVRPAVVHVHNTFAAMSPAVFWAAGRSPAAVVQTLHNYRLVCPNALTFRSGGPCTDCIGRRVAWPGVLHACYHDSRAQTAGVAAMLSVHRTARTWRTQVDASIALTAFSRRLLLGSGLDPGRVFVKPNFVPDPGERTTTGDFCIYVGRLSPLKGIGTLLQAWRSLPDVPLTLVGDGPLREEVRANIQNGSLPSVRWIGHIAHAKVLALIRQARLCLMPSDVYENLPLVVLEAFACGVPVIGSNHGALTEIVEAGRTGWLCPPADASTLATLIQSLWDDPETTVRAGHAARLEFEQRYTADRNYEALMRIYASAITHKGGQVPELPKLA